MFSALQSTSSPLTHCVNGATYKSICEVFSALQSTSGVVTEFENGVQIDE